MDFAANLYSVTTIGTTVIIADNKSAPKETVKPGLLLSSKTGTAAGAFKWAPEKAPKGSVSIIISGAAERNPPMLDSPANFPRASRRRSR